MSAYLPIHFFKEKQDKIQSLKLISFLEGRTGMTTQYFEDKIQFTYEEKLGFKAYFSITKSGNVKNLFRLNPKFIELNLKVDIPLLTPNYIFEKFVGLITQLVEEFNLHVYCEVFEDITTLKEDLLITTFTFVKDYYIKKYKDTLNKSNIYLVNSTRLTEYLKYLDELYDLQIHYKDLRTYVPNYSFYIHKNNELVVTCDYELETLSVFPPGISYLQLNDTKSNYFISYFELLKASENILSEVPGFLKTAKVITKKNAKKFYKIFRKHKFEPINLKKEDLRLISYKQLVD